MIDIPEQNRAERLYANISNYMVEGRRTVKWVVENYEVYHRTFSSIVNSIVNAGFLIEECEESHVSEGMRKKLSGSVWRNTSPTRFYIL